MMKRIFCFILTMAFFLTGINASVVHAATLDVQNETEIEARSSNSVSANISFNSAHSGSATLENVGALPTISVTLNGNPNLYFKVTVSCPSGKYTISSSTPANGTTVSKKIITLRSGDNYVVEVTPSGGTSSGQTYSGTASATW